MILNAQYRRFSVLAFLLAMALGALSYRLFDLQILRHEELSGLAEKNTIRTISSEALRGQILDIRGNPLATSTPVKTVCADPSLLVTRYLDVAKALAPVLQTNEDYLVKRIAGSPTFSPGSFKGFDAFALKLKEKRDALSAFLNIRFSEATRQALSKHQAGETNLAPILTLLSQDLNAVIAGECLFSTQRFARICLSDSTKQLLRENPQGEKLMRLNRLLLEDAYPQGISRIQFVILKRKVSLDEWQKVQAVMTNLTFGLEGVKLTRDQAKEQAGFYNLIRFKSVFDREDQIRSYPNKTLAAHVIGYVDKSEAQDGLTGIEAVFNKNLKGSRGWRKTELDLAKREIVPFCDEEVAPRNGLNVVLTLDAGLQNIVETELEEGMRKNSPISISCIVVRPRTGEILAMASLPSYDPSDPGKSTNYLKNRVISDYAEPGSTFKIVPVSAGLNEKIVNLNSLFFCENGTFHYAGRPLHDHDPYGMLSVEAIITKSSNIGAAKVGMKLGEAKLYDYIHNYGFGVKTGIPLPGEISGLVHPVKGWTKVSIAQIPMGQGVAVTPLQMVMAMSAIANKGLLMRPMLVDRLMDENGKLIAKYDPQPLRHVISEAAARDMVTALKTVPTKQGTAELAQMEHYTVAGKTGTAQKNANGRYINKYFSSFIGFFPADNPELCISVVLDDPDPKHGHFGGRTAGPVFRAIAERAANYLNIKPDLAVEFDPENYSNAPVRAPRAERSR